MAMVLRRVGQRLRQAGLRLALLALVIQAALPLLLAVELRALAAAATDTEIAQSLCRHDGSTPATPGSHPDCTPSSCPICSTLVAASMLALTAAPTPILPAFASETPAFTAAPAPFGAFPPLSYRSRAPPLV